MINILVDKLPTEYKGLKINTNFRSFILFELLMQDNTINESEKIFIALNIFFEEEIKDIKKAIDCILWFYSRGKNKENNNSNEKNLKSKKSKMIYSYETDADLIYSAFLDQYNIDLNEIDYLHWFKFKAMFEGLKDDNKICEVMGYRAININNIKDEKERKKYRKLQEEWALPDNRSDKEKENDFANSLWKRGEIMQLMKLNIQLFADGKVVIETDLDSKGFKSGLSKMQSIAKTGFKAVATSVGVVSTAMTGLIGFGVKYNAEIEQLQTSFEVMTGSAEKARDVISELQKIGAETPFEVKDLAKATNLLMSFGFGAEDAIDSMLMLGDIAQGSSEKLDTISKAYGRMVSSQKVTLEDMNMMIDSGFNPLQIIVENTGESMKSLYDRISKGTMSVEEITEAMKQATSVG